MKHLLISITQRLKDIQVDDNDPSKGKFDFFGGCTLIFNMDSKSPSLRYAITRRIDDQERLDNVRKYKQSQHRNGLSLRETYFSAGQNGSTVADEPFCMLHGDH